MIQERFCLDVTLGTSEDKQQNVVVLSGVDLVVPLEADLDGDPLNDDVVRLEGADGSCWILSAGHPDVRLDLDKNLCLYTFRTVPNGVYKISVKLSDDVWSTVVTGIVVDRNGASLGGSQLTARAPQPIPEDVADEGPEDSQESEGIPDDLGLIIDDDSML